MTKKKIELCSPCFAWKYYEEPYIDKLRESTVKIKCADCGYVRTVASSMTQEELNYIIGGLERMKNWKVDDYKVRIKKFKDD